MRRVSSSVINALQISPASSCTCQRLAAPWNCTATTAPGATTLSGGAAADSACTSMFSARIANGRGEAQLLCQRGVGDIGAADEARHERRGRPQIQLARRRQLLDAPLVEHRDAIGHRQGLTLVVGHVDEGDAELLLQALELDLHFLAQLEVERAQRLVEQQHLGAVDQRARQRDPLALAAGQLRRPALALRAQLHQLEHFARARCSRSAFATPRTRGPYATFSSTVMCGNSA